MKQKDLAQLAELIVRFANERNAKRRAGMLVRISSAAFMQGFLVLMGAKEKVDDEAEFQSGLIRLLDEIAGHGFTAGCSVSLWCTSEVGAKPWMKFSSKDPDVLVHLLAFLLFFQGFKGIMKCQGCGKFFIIKKHVTQKTCSNQCRQKVFQAQLSSKDKKKQRERRSELYHQKKRGEK